MAHAAQAGFIRVNVLAGVRVTDQGIVEGIAHELLRDRRSRPSAHEKSSLDPSKPRCLFLVCGIHYVIVEL